MCGRFSLQLNEIPNEAFGTKAPMPYHPNNDIRPTDSHPVVIFTPEGNQWLELNWGFRPESSTRPLISARSESVNEESTFKHAFREHRCLIALNGWYEWKGKQRYFLRIPGQPVFARAGIGYGGEDRSFVSLTTGANVQSMDIHERMPALIRPDDYNTWLRADPPYALPLLLPYPEELEIVPTEGPYVS